MYRSFEELEVWRRASELAVRVYRELNGCRDFGLRDQMQRSAVSIASNIAEGSERGGKDFIRYLTIARGSAAELRTQAYISGRVGILSDNAMHAIADETRNLAKMLFALGQSIQDRPHPQSRSPKL